jgi:phage tail-like protein
MPPEDDGAAIAVAVANGATALADAGANGMALAIPGVPNYRSTYLDYLPGMFTDNEFLGRFLLIFESILSPLDRTVGNLGHYFDADLAPADVLPWLGGWVGLVLDDRWPEGRRRDLIRSAAELYAWRGTRRGLSTFVRLYTGITPEIVEPTSAEVAADRNQAYTFTLRLRQAAGQPIDRAMLQTIIDIEKPAFAACSLDIVAS